MRQEVDIFDSDLAFISFASTLLTAIGLAALLIEGMCLVIPGRLCEMELISLFARLPEFETGMIGFTLPLAALVLGLSLKIYTSFSWWVMLGLMSMLSLFFGFMIYFHFTQYRMHEFGMSQEMPRDILLPYVESGLTHLCLMMMCLGGIIYMATKRVRQIYRQNTLLKG